MAATTLTGLIPNIYDALDTVSREQTGLIRAVGMDAKAEMAAVQQVIRSAVVPAIALENLTPSNVAADTPAQTIGYVDITITNSKSAPFGITGEEELSLATTGMFPKITTDRITQCFRALSNAVEADLSALHIGASRAFGTATGTPFGTAADLSDFAAMRQVMEENGAPLSDLHCVLGSTSTARIRGKQSGLFKVNEAGSDELLRTGAMGNVQGFDLHWSPATKTAVTVGTGAAYTTTAAGFAVGVTSIPLITGTGTVLAGDIVTFAGDANQYVVATGVAAPGTIVIAEPGLRVAMSAATKALTIVAATTRNMFFHRGAIQLATRRPAMPSGGDDADEVMMIQDPVSGINYEFVKYKQKRQVRYEVNLAWGVAVVQPRHLGLLIGA